MAAALDDPVLEALQEIVGLLTDGEQPRWAARVESLAEEVQAAGPGRARQEAIRSVLHLYDGGMGGFLDLVLQDMSGALPEQRRFDQRRDELYQLARAELR